MPQPTGSDFGYKDTPHKKKGQHKKPFEIQWKRKSGKWPSLKLFSEWSTWKRYATEGQRDEALKALIAKDSSWEYRAGQ